jgi:thiol-disulfide isomerase/thioredoxin
MRRMILIGTLLLVVAVFVLASCTNQTGTAPPTGTSPDSQVTDTDDDMSGREDNPPSSPPDEHVPPPEPSQPARLPLWRTAEFSDVRTGERFSIADLQDRPILLESFAVWCPTCLKQQKEIEKLHDIIGDEAVSISLDTDPNEDEAKVLEFLDENGFSWYYAVSPREVTQSLIDEFGVTVVNAPSAPVVLICGDQHEFLSSGVKTVDDLQAAIGSCRNG